MADTTEPAASPRDAGQDLAVEYDRLRAELQALATAPSKDMVAIDAVLERLDAVHAAFKAAHGRRDQQRY